MPFDEQAVVAVADSSAISKYWWQDRGRAPASYIRGMALVFAQARAQLAAGDPVTAAITVAPTGNPATDVLDWYKDRLSGAGAELSTEGERLVAIFAILLGLGMRESSGRHCEGHDAKVDYPTAANAEAGLFQVSYDSIHHHPLLAQLVETFQGREDLLPVFSLGVNCGPESWENIGDGPARDFQALMKRNPKLAALYAAVLLRHRRSHWGPINSQAAEVTPDALALFRAVETA